MNLLIGIQIVIVSMIVLESMNIKIFQVFESSESNNTERVKTLLTYYRVYYAFDGIMACSSNTVHWVFAMKYWGVAKKLKLLDEKHDPE